MATFAGASFYEHGPDYASYASRLSGRRIVIPGSPGRVIWQRVSLSSQRTLTRRAECSAAEWAALDALIGTEGSLVLGNTTATAILTRVEPTAVWNSGTYLVDLSFRLV
jgi:hypothetical protein